MKNYRIESFITIREHNQTKNNIKDIMKNALLQQYIFIDRSLQPIEVNIDILFDNFQKNDSDIWYLKAKQAYIKVQINPQSIILTPMDSQEHDFDLYYYVELMLCLCENVLIWNFEAKEV